MIDEFGDVAIISTPEFASTGGWQTWTTTSETVELLKGRYQMRIVITQSPFNMNWLEFSYPTSIENAQDLTGELMVYPNPSDQHYNILMDIEKNQDAQIKVFNSTGQLIQSRFLTNVPTIQEQISLDGYPAGIYYLKIELENAKSYSSNLVKNKN